MKSKKRPHRTIEDVATAIQRANDQRDAADKLCAQAKADLEVAVAALTKIKNWEYLKPPQFHTNVPAFDFIWLRDVVAAGLYRATQKT